MPNRRASLATSPPIRPTPTITTVRPAIGVMKTGSHRRSRWRVTKCGTPWFSIRRAVIAYSPPLGMCTPLALVSTTSGGRSGTSFSTPALVDWIHRRCGARAARSRPSTCAAIKTSASRSPFSRAGWLSPKVTRRRRRRCATPLAPLANREGVTASLGLSGSFWMWRRIWRSREGIDAPRLGLGYGTGDRLTSGILAHVGMPLSPPAGPQPFPALRRALVPLTSWRSDRRHSVNPWRRPARRGLGLGRRPRGVLMTRREVGPQLPAFHLRSRPRSHTERWRDGLRAPLHRGAMHWIPSPACPATASPSAVACPPSAISFERARYQEPSTGFARPRHLKWSKPAPPCQEGSHGLSCGRRPRARECPGRC